MSGTERRDAGPGRVVEVGEPVMDPVVAPPVIAPPMVAPPVDGSPTVASAPPIAGPIVAQGEVDAEGTAEAEGAETPAPAVGLDEAGLEALLFVAERPLSRREIATLAGVDRETVDARLGDLEVSLAGRGIRLVVAGDRVELATAPEAGELIARWIGADAIHLSPASLETLAIVAYRQPVTRAVVERIRGVDSDYTIRSLLHRRLVVELGRSEAPGRPYLYGTGFDFLERFGLTSLDELPPLDPEVAARLVDATTEAYASDDPPGAAVDTDAASTDGDRA